MFPIFYHRVQKPLRPHARRPPRATGREEQIEDTREARHYRGSKIKVNGSGVEGRVALKDGDIIETYGYKFQFFMNK